MATNYPNALDDFPDPDPNENTNSSRVPHADQHKNANDAIEAIEAELGTNPSSTFTTVSDRLNTMETDLADLLNSVGDISGITTEQVHDIVGALIAAGLGLSVLYDDANDTVIVTNTDRGSAARTAHEADSDPHAAYYNQARGDARYSLAAHTHNMSTPGHTHDYAPLVHTHSEYADLSHEHAYAASSHTHDYTEITNFDYGVQTVMEEYLGEGQNITIYSDDINNKLYISSSSTGGSGTGTVEVYYQSTAPATPSEGIVWFDTATPVYGIQVPAETATPTGSVGLGSLFDYGGILMYDNGRYKTPIGGDPKKYFKFETDFFHAGAQGITTTGNANGGATSNNQPASTSRFGVIQLETGTTSNATGYCWVSGNSGTGLALSSTLEFMTEAIVNVQTLNGTASVDCAYVIGLSDEFNISSEPANGIYFRYTPASTQWVAVARTNNVESILTTSATVAANTWVTLRMFYYGPDNKVYYYVDDTHVATLSTNIPLGTSYPIRPMLAIGKRSSTTTSRNFLLDYWMFYYIFKGTR